MSKILLVLQGRFQRLQMVTLHQQVQFLISAGFSIALFTRIQHETTCSDALNELWKTLKSFRLLHWSNQGQSARTVLHNRPVRNGCETERRSNIFSDSERERSERGRWMATSIFNGIHASSHGYHQCLLSEYLHNRFTISIAKSAKGEPTAKVPC